MGEKHVRIIWAVVLIGVCAFLLLSFLSYDPLDIFYLTSHPNEHLRNQGGRVGAYLVFGLLTAVGWSAYFIPVLFTFWAAGKLMEKTSTPILSRLIGFLFVIWSFSSMMSTLTNAYDISRVATGGILGFYTSTHLMRYFGEVGTLIILGTIFFLSLLLATEFLVVPFFLQIARLAVQLVVAAKPRFSFAARPRQRERPVTAVRRIKPERRLSPELRPGRSEESRSPDDGEADSADSPAERAVDMAKEAAARFFKPKLVVKKPKPPKTVKPTEQQQPSASKFVGDYKLPSLDLLVPPPPLEDRMIKDDLEGNSKILEETLRDFGIEAKVVEVEQGPVITLYELQPAPGVKITKITSLGDDIALSMKAPSVHIVAPMPGKGTVGIQVPNIQASLVYLKELLETPEFQNAKSKLTMAMGKDISGNPLVSDLADMPHFLIAGTTGSGKTVCVNSLIMSFIFQASPEEVKLILIDPKMVEMSMYNGLPHLVCPVITDIKKAAGALDWAVNEMEERYRLLAKVGVRNIMAYNKKFKDGGLTEIEDGEQKITLEHMPYIIIIIDELADMMLLAAKEVETSITRLAQLSRGVGIHLILATQRPSVDVITGVIKANFPARISFRVASKVDSRTVLDANGAEKLLGKGDMLFMKPGNYKLIRAQASLVSDKEIENVVNFAKEQRAAVYSDAVTKEHDKVLNFSKGKDGARDELFEEAAKLVITTRQASVSILQRRLRLGYARAARLIDMMEEQGIIGGFRGSKAREILVESWDDVAFAREPQSGPQTDAGQ